MKRTVKINILGKVQGVGFRYGALKKANELQLKGFVKNRTDGSVYVEIEGEKEIIDQFICGVKWARLGQELTK